jgi:hypothetical protein
MRLILVDNCSDEVCGDVSAGPRMFQKLPSHTTSAEIEALAKASARLADETVGRHSRSYRFYCFRPSKKCLGYQLYIAPRDTAICSGTSAGNERVGATLTDVLTKCFYFGFVSSLAKPKGKGLRMIRRFWRAETQGVRRATEKVDPKGAT